MKEQSFGLYAQTMAERGFVTLAFDPSFTGESGGEPRNLASPDINAEDFMAAVDFIACGPKSITSGSTSSAFAVRRHGIECSSCDQARTSEHFR